MMGRCTVWTCSQVSCTGRAWCHLRTATLKSKAPRWWRMLSRSWAHTAVQWQAVFFSRGQKRWFSFVSLSVEPRVPHVYQVYQFTRSCHGLFRCCRPQPFGKLPGVDAKSGDRLWEVKAPGAVFASPAIQGRTMRLARMQRPLKGQG